MEVVARAVRAALRHAGSSALGEQVVDAMLVEPSQHALPLSGGDGDGVPLFTGRVTSVIAFVRCRVAWVLWVGAVASLWGYSLTMVVDSVKSGYGYVATIAIASD